MEYTAARNLVLNNLLSIAQWSGGMQRAGVALVVDLLTKYPELQSDMEIFHEACTIVGCLPIVKCMAPHLNINGGTHTYTTVNSRGISVIRTSTYLPLLSALSNEAMATADYLVGLGADPNVYFHGAPIIFKYNYLGPEVYYLVECGANIHLRDDDGGTILHRRAAGCNAKMVEYFMKLGVDPTIRDNAGRRPIDCVPDGVDRDRVVRALSGEHE